MKAKFVYPYANGLQWSLFKNMKPVLVRGVIYATGHVFAEPENALEKGFPSGVLCGAKIDLEHLPENMKVSTRTKRIVGVPICEKCQKILKTIPTSENKKLAAWSRGL